MRGGYPTIRSSGRGIMTAGQLGLALLLGIAIVRVLGGRQGAAETVHGDYLGPAARRHAQERDDVQNEAEEGQDRRRRGEAFDQCHRSVSLIAYKGAQGDVWGKRGDILPRDAPAALPGPGAKTRGPGPGPHEQRGHPQLLATRL